MSHHKLEVKDLHFAYDLKKPVIAGIDFQIHHGDSVGIVGANGAGKSTLLLLLMGVLQAQSGEIIVGDTHLTPHTLPLIRQKLGLVFQDPDDQLFMPTVFDDVAFGPRNSGQEDVDVNEQVMRALEQVGIVHLKDRPPYRLSGGEKRAAAVATVLSMHPDFLILDEPTTSLDPATRRRVIRLLQIFEHTKIITSHDLDMILEVCERTIILRHGKVIADGRTSELFANESLMKQADLELPLSMQNCPVCGIGKGVVPPT